MTDLNQLAEDSFESALRRNPKFNSDSARLKIYEEVEEFECATFNKDADSPHCPELTAVEEELADVILSCLVFSKCENIDIEKALRIKNEFNKRRS